MRKSGGYYLLSFFSFCIFTIIFHVAAAHAQSQQPSYTPSPPTISIPTPTIYIAPTITLTPTPLPTAIPTPTTAPTPTGIPVSTPLNLDSLFTTFANLYHTDKNELEKIANCESGFNPNSNYNGIYVGMFQFAQQTWMSVRSNMGLDPNPSLRSNAQDSIQTAAYMLSLGEKNAWPSCN